MKKYSNVGSHEPPKTPAKEASPAPHTEAKPAINVKSDKPATAGASASAPRK